MVEETPVLVEASPTPVETALEQDLLFSEDFTDNSKKWRVRTTGIESFYLKDGKYHIAQGTTDKMTDDATACLPDNPIFGDFILEVEATQIKGPDTNNLGIVFRNSGPGNSYKFVISPVGSFVVSKGVDNVWFNPIPLARSTAINPGKATNPLKLIAKGNNISIFANGVELGTVNDSSHTSGTICLMAGTWNFNLGNAQRNREAFAKNPGTEAVFDNLKIWATP